jgi:hypothetical protein
MSQSCQISTLLRRAPVPTLTPPSTAMQCPLAYGVIPLSVLCCVVPARQAGGGDFLCLRQTVAPENPQERHRSWHAFSPWTPHKPILRGTEGSALISVKP